MSARDELAQVIYEADPWLGLDANSQPTFPIPWAELDEDDRENFHPQADAILAAGYRKPRAITTAVELDALAEGSVILSNGGEDSAQKDGEGYWYLWGGDVGLCPEEIMLPATVLHDPEAQL